MNAEVSEIEAPAENPVGSAKKPVRETETVTMEDGRKVEFVGPKRRVLKESIIDAENGTVAIRMDFRNGATRLYPINPDLLLRFAAHGAEQKYGDELAGQDGDLDDWVATTDALHERLAAGDWSIQRGPSQAGTSILLKALVELTGKPVESIRAFLKTKSKDEKDAMKESSKLKPIVQRLEAEKRAKAAQVDTESLFGELDSVA